MSRTYSLYEAKAKLSEIIRGVRERGETVTVSYRGEPVAEIRPVAPETTDIARRIGELERRGILTAPSRIGAKFPAPLAKRPGALARFLDDRDG
jgi:prevent-host-death family protein